MFMTSGPPNQMYMPMSSQYSQPQPKKQFGMSQHHTRQGFDNFETDLMGGLDMPPDITEIDADIRKCQV
jgi:hypothetical protein